MRRLAIVGVALSLAACSGAGPTTGPGGTTVPAGSQAAATGGGTAGAAGPAASYGAGTATASVEVGGTSYPMSGGTCKQASTGAYTFELVIGTFQTAPYLDVFVADFSTPLRDGPYQGGTNLVSVQVASANLAVPATITLTNGLTAGSFSGTSAGNDPRQVSGTFTC